MSLVSRMTSLSLLGVVTWLGLASASTPAVWPTPHDFGVSYCAEGFTCYNDTASGVVWVKKDSGNVNGPNCKSVCEDALCGSGAFHSCIQDYPAFQNMTAFESIAYGLNFTCRSGGCWGSVSGQGQMWVTRGDDPDKRCYFPEGGVIDCNTNPGNANCFGERYSLICPCEAREVNEACKWDSPPHVPAEPRFPAGDTHTSCIDRINYWRKRACDEGWVECPPCGLPPMTECTCCHECANSQSEYDSQNGAHASFTRCGERVQGQGGGANCAAVIDAFVSERAPDANGTMRCQGHCGPIVRHGCQTFFWGRSQGGNFHTLNWRSCNEVTCGDYCAYPDSNECFELDPANGNPIPNRTGCYVSPPRTPTPTTSLADSAGSQSGGQSVPGSAGSDGSAGSATGSDPTASSGGNMATGYASTLDTAPSETPRGSAPGPDTASTNDNLSGGSTAANTDPSGGQSGVVNTAANMASSEGGGVSGGTDNSASPGNVDDTTNLGVSLVLVALFWA